MNTMNRIALGTVALIAPLLVLAPSADAARSAHPSHGCKVLSVEILKEDRPGATFAPDEVQVEPPIIYTEVKQWAKTITTLKCKGRIIRVVSLWYPRT